MNTTVGYHVTSASIIQTEDGLTERMKLLDDAHVGKLRIDFARDTNNGVLVGYCISSVKRDGLGEIDSIFIESGYRCNGIGNNLIKSALDWLKKQTVKKIIVQVLVGNEVAHPFYNRYGFLPRTTIMMQIDENDTSRS